MASIKDHLLQVTDTSPILRKKLFNVPMRLFRSDYNFKKVILDIVGHMQATMNTKYDDYTEVKGISGANVGIPYNIVIIKDKEKKEDLIFINPIMAPMTEEMVEVESNCGSVVLKEPIKVKRHKKIVVSWFDHKDGKYQTQEFEGQLGNTIQHEIEHNLGILITDKEAK